MLRAWIRLPNDERLHLRRSVWTGVLRVYHEKRVPGPTLGEKTLVKVMEMAPAGQALGKSWADWLRKADLFTGEAEGRARFQIGEVRIEIEFRFAEGVVPLLYYIYQPCELIVHVDGMPAVRRRFF
jgi:hypothetical protein